MIKQVLHQSLQQKLSPQQIQLMKLIELSTLELEQKVKDEIETNPAIEDETLSTETQDENFEEDINENFEETDFDQEFDIDQYISDDEIPEYKMYANNFSEDNMHEKAPIVGGQTHLDILKVQLGEVKLKEKDQKIGEYVIGCVDDDGYIRRTIEEIIDDLVFKETLVCEEVEVKKIISIVQNFDPPGIGARTLQECLVLQLEKKEQTKEVLFAIDIINLQFKQFVNKHYDKICQRFKVDETVLKTAIFEIEKLNPKPAFNSNQTKYTQQTFQMELPLTDDYQLNLQYFKYKLDDDKFKAINPLGPYTLLPDLPLISLPDEITLEDIEGALKGVFVPGVGAPFSNLSSESCFISIEKKLLNNNLQLTISTLMDLDKGYGELASFEADYNFGNGLNAMFGLTKILGDDEAGEDYIFNNLEDFSHLRFEIKYHF